MPRPPYLPFETKLAQVWPPEQWLSVGTLVAISGGADSVALLRAMTRLAPDAGPRLVAAHFNHHLRGEEAAADQRFVSELCRELSVAIEIGCPSEECAIATRTSGIEAAARRARYAFLEAVARRRGLRYVATAHTADDQAETILHRIVRGTGMSGLSGMARARPLGPAATLLRPLLGFRRTEVLEYLDALGQPFRHDSTNDDTRWTRNRIRHELLPHLASAYNPGIVDALLRLGRLAGEVQAVVGEIVEKLQARCVERAGPGSVQIARKPLADQPVYVVREVLMAVWRDQGWPLQSMGFDEWERLAQMVLGNSAAGSPRACTFPGGILAELSEDVLRLNELPQRGGLSLQ
ncbi:MAG: tRNA lysidine(34) synthetase TilS [Thermoguttaceae bacterium]|jgi:tRNA(Ile)-lysidine synthase|nr:tRNA lysidine(34) synthetase TilS [Thermoguttaceae bacterium]